ncbi:MAG: CpXC domain-containing protein [Candidatus Thorarchaeota archaeon]
MVGTSTITVKCERCQHEYEVQVVDHIDVGSDTESVKLLKANRLSQVQCPKCKKVMQMDTSVVLNFEPENLIVLYDPQLKSEEDRAEIRRIYDSVVRFNEILEETAHEIDFRIVTSMDELTTLLDDYAQKHGLS